MQFYFIRLNSAHYLIMKIPNKRKLQQIAFNHSSDIDFRDFMNIAKNLLQNHIHITLVLDNPIRFRKNLLERI